MNLIGRFQLPGKQLFLKKGIFRWFCLFYLICCNTCLVYPQQAELRKIEVLFKETETYNDFERVRRISDEIIQLSGKINRFDLQIKGIYQFCWSADYHKRMPEFQAYLQSGRKIMSEHAAEFDRLDTFGIHRAYMIHAGGIYSYAMGNFEKAIEEFSIIISDGQVRYHDSLLLNSVYSFMGQSYYNMGRLDKSFQHFELANKFGTNDEYSVGLNYMYQYQILYSLGKIHEAFSLLQQALSIFRNFGQYSAVRNALKANYMLKASFYKRLEVYDSAIYYTRKSFEHLSRDDYDFINAYLLLGDIFYNHKELDSAFRYYSKSLAHSNYIFKDNHYLKSRSLAGIGNVYRSHGNFEKADQYYKEGIRNIVSEKMPVNITVLSMEDLSVLLLPYESMKVMIEQGRLYFQWFQHNAEMNYLDTCIAILESALFLNDIGRRELVNMETKETKAQLQSDITDLGVEASSMAYSITGNQKYLNKSFSFMEKGKANILMDQVNEVRARKFSGIPAALLEEEMRLKGELSINKDRFLRMKSSDAQFGDTKIQYDDKLREYITLISEMEQKYPKYYRLKYNAKNIESEEIREKLTSGKSLLIQYYVGKDKIYMVGITRKQTVLKVTERNREFNDHLELLLKQLSNENITEVENDSQIFRDFVRASLYLYGKLLSPLLRDLKKSVKELTIIPDGSLCYLPFEILLNHPYPHNKPDYSQLPYIFKQYEVKYDYSASLIFEEEDKMQKSARPYVGYAPSYENYNTEELSFGFLYANQEEIEACRNIWKGVAVAGDKATTASFRELSPDINILHLALHTVLNDEDPQMSSLAFAFEGQGNENGLLYTYELYNMNIPARLVILSGCETGIGNIKKGEGIISLARAFKFAGSRNILMSLWKVNDQTTKEIMIEFTHNLKKGMEKDRALQQAKIAYLKKSKNLHPAFWSSFVLIGNDSPLSHNHNRTYYFAAIACCLVVLLLIFYLKRHAIKH